MAFELPPLPYDKKALEPYMSASTLDFHHGKHHRAYVETLNKLIAGKPFERQPLEAIVREAYESKKDAAIFNNAAQAWNHAFFWASMKPKGGGDPAGDLAKRIEKDFGTFEAFRAKFKEAATTQFGSGWAWLVMEGGKLSVIKTPNAVNPLALGKAALLACDVWEHAYYLDFQNRRPDFVQSFLDHLVNWDFVAENLAKAAK